MFYVNWVYDKCENAYYKVFDTISLSFDIIRETDIIKMIQCGAELKNIDLQGNKLILHKWPHFHKNTTGNDMTTLFRTGSNLVLLKTAHKDSFWVIGEFLMHLDFHDFKDKLFKYGISNCEIAENIDYNNFSKSDLCKINCIDMMPVNEIDKDFEQYIDEQYNKYVAKCKLMGIQTTFKYRIDGHEVIIKQGKTNGDTVIIPPFITCIESDAFTDRDIQTLKLNKGLKIIGDRAFYFNEIQTVEIPDTVQFIGRGAFLNNTKLHIEGNSTFRACKYKEIQEQFIKDAHLEDIE